MIKTKEIIDAFISHGVDYYSGVPDSLLKQLNFALESDARCKVNITVNEGAAVADAIGYNLVTNRMPAVFMQNSGLGNAVNPLTSLANKDIYGIPMLLLIGWRGEILQDKSQLKDEPQHRAMGRMTLEMLETLEIPYLVVGPEHMDWRNGITDLLSVASAESKPVALVFRKGSFENTKINYNHLSHNPSREEYIKEILKTLDDSVALVSTTGVASREVYESRENLSQKNGRDFLTVGGMGFALQIAESVARNGKLRKVVCIDGDGAALMHLGVLTQSSQNNKLIHILVNNGVHDSVGGQKLNLNEEFSFVELAKTCGYRNQFVIEQPSDCKEVLNKSMILEGSCFIEIKARPGFRSNLGRPKSTPKENKQGFKELIVKLEK